MSIIGIVVPLIVALGGGTSLAAQGALPGDALYPVKVNFNENVKGAFSFSTEAKADADIDAIEARMVEAQKLSAESRLNAETQAVLNAGIEARVAAVEEKIERLQQDGDWAAAAEVAAKFQAIVMKHASVLAETSARADANAQTALAPILNRAQMVLNAASNISVNASAQAAARGDTSTSGSANSNSNASGNASTRGNATSSTNANTNANVQVQTGTGVEVGL